MEQGLDLDQLFPRLEGWAAAQSYYHGPEREHDDPKPTPPSPGAPPGPSTTTPHQPTHGGERHPSRASLPHAAARASPPPADASPGGRAGGAGGEEGGGGEREGGGRAGRGGECPSAHLAATAREDTAMRVAQHGLPAAAASGGTARGTPPELLAAHPPPSHDSTSGSSPRLSLGRAGARASPGGKAGPSPAGKGRGKARAAPTFDLCGDSSGEEDAAPPQRPSTVAPAARRGAGGASDAGMGGAGGHGGSSGPGGVSGRAVVARAVEVSVVEVVGAVEVTAVAVGAVEVRAGAGSVPSPARHVAARGGVSLGRTGDEPRQLSGVSGGQRVAPAGGIEQGKGGGQGDAASVGGGNDTHDHPRNREERERQSSCNDVRLESYSDAQPEASEEEEEDDVNLAQSSVGLLSEQPVDLSEEPVNLGQASAGDYGQASAGAANEDLAPYACSQPEEGSGNEGVNPKR
ncbi:hypothetical protein T484DRAFT_1896257 [Baffinella frigidus]|nr:hypothetical protein T484DRAFT_1896257 [Cryptophyta sp. CCMP2293]